MQGQVNRHIFIGDIQGCRVELEALLSALRFDSSGDRLHPVGDLVNRGPDSVGTLRLLRSLDAEPVLGNHDLHLVRVAAGSRELKRSDTFGDVLDADDREPLLAWLREQPFVREIGSTLQVHAGLHPAWADPIRQLSGIDPLIPNPDSDFATRVRTCDREGRRPEESATTEESAFRAWYHQRPSPDSQTVVFGHWAAQGLLVEPGLRGLDTGCVWGGTLTAWIAEEDRLVEVPAARTYCRHD